MYIFLLLKTHNVTGLKYLCKHSAYTEEDCHTYKGSGTYWKKHIRKYGYDVTTQILFQTKDKNQFQRVALQYSQQFDIVKSDKWANLTEEKGQGGRIYSPEYYAKKSKEMWSNPDFRQKNMDRLLSNIKNIQPLAAKAAKKILTGKKKSEEHKANMRGRRPHVSQSGNLNNNAKPIYTPFGVFGSIKEASINIKGHTYMMIWRKLKKNIEGWGYIK